MLRGESGTGSCHSGWEQNNDKNKLKVAQGKALFLLNAKLSAEINCH